MGCFLNDNGNTFKYLVCTGNSSKGLLTGLDSVIILVEKSNRLIATKNILCLDMMFIVNQVFRVR